jgi:hypothetical protein
MKPYWLKVVTISSKTGKLENHHEIILVAGMMFLSGAKLEKRHEIILVAGMKFLSQAKLGSWKITMKPFWLLA